MAEFFELTTPRHMLEKAKREFQGLANEIDSDKIFNFFVTAYHVYDYIKRVVPEKDMNDIRSNPDFKKCRYICNKNKHRTLRKGDDEFITYRRPGAVFGEAVFGESLFNGKRAYFIIDKNEQVDVLELGQKIINLWEAFFNEYNV